MKRITFLFATVAMCVLAAVALPATKVKSRSGEIKFNDVEKQTREFIGYFDSIKLTPEEEKIKQEALSQMPAPCCSKFSMATCCCPCNLAKAAWGLSNYLIATQGLQADEVRATVKRWIEFTHPKGFSGNACFDNQCDAPFSSDGCGGMNQNKLVF